MTKVWLYAFLQYFGSFSNAVKVYLFEVKITNLKIYSDFCSQNLIKLTVIYRYLLKWGTS